jgi:SAM-dependent methyltransferase
MTRPEADGCDSGEFWEERYRGRERVWSGNVNAVFAGVVAPLPPGRALDLGCGEGSDAVWLAKRGWHVIAVDVSATALARVRAQAAEAGVEARVETQQHDLASSLPTGAFDLVSAQFLQSPIEFPRERVLRATADLVAPGGLLLIVDHGSSPPWSSHHDTDFPTPEDTLAALGPLPGQWDTELLETRDRIATGPDGQTATLTDIVVALRRREPT